MCCVLIPLLFASKPELSTGHRMTSLLDVPGLSVSRTYEGTC